MSPRSRASTLGNAAKATCLRRRRNIKRRPQVLKCELKAYGKEHPLWIARSVSAWMFTISFPCDHASDHATDRAGRTLRMGLLRYARSFRVAVRCWGGPLTRVPGFTFFFKH